MSLDRQQLEIMKQGVDSVITNAFAPYKDLIKGALGPFAEEIGGIGGLYGRQWRLEREIAFWEKYKEVVRRVGREPKPVPPKTFFPILHQAFLESDDDLQLRWAKLLATASTDAEAYRPIFADILRTLIAVEVQALDLMYKEFLTYYRDRYEGTMPKSAAVEDMQIGDESSLADHLITLGHLQAKKWDDLYLLSSDIDSAVYFSDKARVRIVLDSLMRNQLVRKGPDSKGRPVLWLTTLGLNFLEACGGGEGPAEVESEQ